LETALSKGLQFLHVDLWGPATAPSTSGCRYFLTCYDNCPRKIHLSFLSRKSRRICNAFVAMTTYIAKVEQQLSCKIMSIRSENGTEFSSAAWST